MKVKQIIIRSKMVKYFKGYSKNQPPKEKKRNFYHVFGIFFIFDKLTSPPPSRCFCPKLNCIFLLVLMATPSHLFDKCPKLFYFFFLRASLTRLQHLSFTVVTCIRSNEWGQTYCCEQIEIFSKEVRISTGHWGFRGWLGVFLRKIGRGSREAEQRIFQAR